MKRKLTYSLLLSSLLIGHTGLALAQDRDKLQEQDRDQVLMQEQQVYGWQLMTEQERLEYRNRMRAMKTLEEREQFRFEHHELMQERAKERGVKLPEAPSPYGRGMGPGGRGGASGGGGAGSGGSGGGSGGR